MMPGTVILKTQPFPREKVIHSCYSFYHLILLPYARVNYVLYYLVIKATFIFVTV